jgi:UDP-2,3-diacylglucosamine hydrolase
VRTPDEIDHLLLVAGEGDLPCVVAKDAVSRGIQTTAFCLHPGNKRTLETITGQKAHSITPGLMQQNLDLAHQLGVTDLVFAGKVNKWLLLKNPRLDALAVNSLRQLWPRNDDAVMVKLIELIANHGLTVWPQSLFLSALRLKAGQLSRLAPSDTQWQDIHFGFELAKQMGRLDVGQTVVVQHGMALAIEAIEGTDQCLLRAGKWSRKGTGAVVVKVAKPEQDERFDMPTVGLRTLKRMKQAGLSVLATEALQTLYLEIAPMQRFADRHGLVLVSVAADTPV